MAQQASTRAVSPPPHPSPPSALAGRPSGTPAVPVAPAADGTVMAGSADGKAARIKLPPVPLTELASLTVVPDDEIVTGVTDTKRSEAQARVDADVKAAHIAWTEAGKPELSLVKGPHRHRYIVSPANAPAVRVMLAKAGLFLGVRVARSVPKRHESGNAMIFWTATDRKPHKPRTVKDSKRKPPFWA
jgi:hypothetical protein